MKNSQRIYRTDFKLLRYFQAVAEELHFGKAAARLNMSQPPLSFHIKELESQLGTLLFIRHSRHVALTYAGQVLLEETRQLLENANLALARVEKIGRGEGGRVHLGIVGTAIWGGLRHGLQQFIADYPAIDLTFCEKSPGDQLVLLERKEIDAGIWRMETSPPGGLQSERLHKATFMVALPENHPLAQQETIDIIQLRKEAFVTMTAVHSDWTFLQRVCREAGFTPRVVREAVEPQTVLALVSIGFGLTIIADSYAQMSWPGVVFRRPTNPIPADLYAVYDPMHLTSTTQQLIAALKSSSGC
ncbi:LysR family transcriptional regulator [Klebsiella sp. BIGb0407]|uniref:LysR family transcriptional regulator n=1 Tax=Klebsiella sp. BIGb0407 TaxID=2940603 RepID=UPI0021695C39|nr:LysR family transcriptional regulator [Klebsiella sp. BIGb0407]MCS3430850.1 DNA-binding transcriptional LysR family regulator [Klebsiella sp. BIGb0407]